MRGLMTILLIGSMLGCRSLGGDRIGAENQNEMAIEVSKRIPTGTPLVAAKKSMESAGFECELIEHGSFDESIGVIGDDRKYRSFENSRYLLCKRTEGTGEFLVSHIWSVALVADKTDNVEDILVRHSMDGP